MSKAKIASKAVTDTGVNITFADDSVEDTSLLLSDLSDEIVQRLALHGLSQKLGDSYSGVKDVVMAAERVKAVISNLTSGNWNAVREGSGSARATDLATAVSKVLGIELSEAIAKLAEKSKEEKSAIRKNGKVARALLEIQAARLEAKTSDDDVDLTI